MPVGGVLTNYGEKPLQIVDSPTSPFAGILSDAIVLNLEYEIEHINEDGSWGPNWSWYGNYNGEWKGYWTIRTLKSLYKFGRRQWSFQWIHLEFPCINVRFCLHHCWVCVALFEGFCDTYSIIVLKPI